MQPLHFRWKQCFTNDEGRSLEVGAQGADFKPP